MGAAEILTHLQADGLRLHADGERLLAEPRNLITDHHRDLIRAHKPALLAHLQAANETDDNLADESAAVMERDNGPSAKTAARAYYDHLMRQDQSCCGCRTNIGALVARFCPEGQRLRDAYINASVEGNA